MESFIKKTNTVYFKLPVILMLTVLTPGCVSIIHQYSPRRVVGWKDYGWKEFGSSHYKYECNGSAVGVYPIQTKPLGYTDKPVLSIDIHNSEEIQEACKLSFLWMENTKTGQQMNPIKVETLPLKDKTKTLCYYSFDIQEDKNVRYNLHFSDRLLGCPINPISYIFEKTWEMPFQEVM